MKLFDKTKIISFVIGAFVVGLFLSLSYSRVFDEFEYSTFDFRYRLRPPQDVDKNIVIIEIADDSIEKLGEWPFPRKYHALLIKALKSSGVKTVIFDIFFSEKTDDDVEFTEAVGEAGNVYFPYVFDLDTANPDTTRVFASGYIAPLIKVLEENAKGTGFINAESDIDGKIRRVPPFIEYNGTFSPHITVRAVLNNLGYEFDKIEIFPGERIVADKNLIIPLGEDSSVVVNYPAVWGKAFRHYSYIDIIQSYLSDMTGQKPLVDLSELEGAVCFIGLTATASPDVLPSPLEPLYPGVGVNASIYNSILKKSFLIRLNRWWNLGILFIIGFLTAYITRRSRKRFALASIFLIMAVYVFVAVLSFWIFGIWIDIFYPLIAIAAVYIIFTFKKYVTEIYKREVLEKELNIAKDIQLSFLPREMPRVGGIEISASMLTARQVGGDLYDFVQLDDNRLGVMIGDVSGKGVPAALYMAKVVSVFKTFVREDSVMEVVKNVNNRLVAESASNLFVTLTYMVFDTKTNSTDFTICGHLPTLLIEPDGNVELLNVEKGMPLGILECDFSHGKREYKPGSIFILYSDGVTEAMNAREEMFDEERLVKLAKTLKGISAKEVVDAVHKAVLNFAGKTKQYDDITVVAIKV